MINLIINLILMLFLIYFLKKKYNKEKFINYILSFFCIMGINLQFFILREYLSYNLDFFNCEFTMSYLHCLSIIFYLKYVDYNTYISMLSTLLSFLGIFTLSIGYPWLFSTESIFILIIFLIFFFFSINSAKNKINFYFLDKNSKNIFNSFKDFLNHLNSGVILNMTVQAKKFY